ncbi:WRKY transcription factor 19 [Phytophthora cinnamomi]|uniref:WRKY transcription factor 19 n=1 Tax=Phytophthora cinnamomi TaxID=4785 RepID=UPI00355A61EB|nr:WRKY transcription factor 19 [Phytophthora cinnamomi]
METILAPMDLQGLWKQPASPNAKSSLVRLPSLFAMTASPTATAASTTPSTEWSPRLVGMSDVLSAQVSPMKEKGLSRLPSIGAMINREPESLSPVQKHCMDLYKQLQAKSPDTELNSLLADAAVSQLQEQQSRKADRAKRTSNAKLCGMAECNKRAKAGGFCIAHGGGLRCSEAGCTKHAVSLGLCISHGGGKRCTVEGCLNASRKNGVCWSHGGKRLCKLEGCNKGPKSGGYCWSHGGKMKK